MYSHPSLHVSPPAPSAKRRYKQQALVAAASAPSTGEMKVATVAVLSVLIYLSLAVLATYFLTRGPIAKYMANQTIVVTDKIAVEGEEEEEEQDETPCPPHRRHREHH